MAHVFDLVLEAKAVSHLQTTFIFLQSEINHLSVAPRLPKFVQGLQQAPLFEFEVLQLGVGHYMVLPVKSCPSHRPILYSFSTLSTFQTNIAQ